MIHPRRPHGIGHVRGSVTSVAAQRKRRDTEGGENVLHQRLRTHSASGTLAVVPLVQVVAACPT